MIAILQHELMKSKTLSSANVYSIYVTQKGKLIVGFFCMSSISRETTSVYKSTYIARGRLIHIRNFFKVQTWNFRRYIYILASHKNLYTSKTS